MSHRYLGRVARPKPRRPFGILRPPVSSPGQGCAWKYPAPRPSGARLLEGVAHHAGEADGSHVRVLPGSPRCSSAVPVGRGVRHHVRAEGTERLLPVRVSFRSRTAVHRGAGRRKVQGPSCAPAWGRSSSKHSGLRRAVHGLPHRAARARRLRTLLGSLLPARLDAPVAET